MAVPVTVTDTPGHREAVPETGSRASVSETGPGRTPTSTPAPASIPRTTPVAQGPGARHPAPLAAPQTAVSMLQGHTLRAIVQFVYQLT